MVYCQISKSLIGQWLTGIPWILSASHGKKFCSMSSLFQTFVSGIKRFFTVVSDESSWGDTICPPLKESSHRCFHILMTDPSPILHRAPLQMTSLACKILLQAKELHGLISASKMLPHGKYFGLNTLYSNVPFSLCNLHTCFPRSASLNCLKSRNPIPPKDFGEHKVLYFMHCIFLVLSWFLHQNLWIIASISLIKIIGNRNTLIE